MESKRIIQVEDKVSIKLLIPLDIQHMFTMFGAPILVPPLFGISLAVMLFMSDMGTLLLIFVTKGEAPAYLGSSSAFLAPAGVVISSFGESGYAYALGGFVVVGLCGCIFASIVYKFSTEWIDVVPLPAAMGPVVASIRLEFSGNVAQNAGLLDEVMDPKEIIVFMITLNATVFGFILSRRLFSVTSTLITVVAGYVAALACEFPNSTAVAAVPAFALPNFSGPKFNLDAIMAILLVFLVITPEHIGHQVAISKIVSRDLLKDPGPYRPLSGDNFSIMISGLIGSVPTTTCGKNIGAMAIIRVYSVCAITDAAIFSTIYSFIGKLSTPISAIPGSMIGDISFLLYGMIGISGLRILMDSKVDYGNFRNLALTLVILVTGLSGIAVRIDSTQLTDMVLACVVGMILDLVFHLLDYSHLTDDQE